ncbi:MAG: TiaS agmantine-binding domain-containing protein [Candidatus Heimdallarchaeaceae archaeon]
MKPSVNSLLHIGFDDTDSLQGSCTTYLAVKIIEKIADFVEFRDYPRLIRNNPNVPWKTRGNGAIALTLGLKDDKDVDLVITSSIKMIEKYHQKDPNTHPGFIAIKGEIPEEVRSFAIKALTDVISISYAKKIAQKFCSQFYFIGNGRGLIGAIAAVGNSINPLEEDFTFELLSYRNDEFIGTKRQIDGTSVKRMDEELEPFVFNNVDEETDKVLISPAGLDPVLYGIRGENPTTLLKAKNIVKTNEPIESYCIFRTNQGTDQHFKYSSDRVRNFSTFKAEIEVIDPPITLEGGHIIFVGKVVETGNTLDVAAFEPSKSFRNIIKKLLPGDKLIAFGGIRYKKEFSSFTLQLEKCEITHISDQFREEAPSCPKCEKRMTSDGRDKGYKCRNCGFKDSHLTKKKIPLQREITTGIFIPPAQAQRHLVKPERRYNLELKNNFSLIDDWWKRSNKA